jgi:LysR family transcriptional regulator, transcriptional activator for bauABCD operon
MQPKARALLGQIADVDLRLLRVFKAVADCGGIAAAELELDIDISTISRHVKDLEERLGLVLCRRGRSGFDLTPEGQKIYAAAEQLLSATDAFRSSLHDIHQRMGGDLHVALFEKTASNPQARISDAIAQFRRDAPQVKLHLHVDNISMIERGVMDGRFQLAVVPEHRRSDSLAYDDLFGERMLLYAGALHPWFRTHRRPRDWSDLREQHLAGLGYHSPNLMLAHARQLERDASASDQEGVATLVLSGCFVGFLPDHYAESFERAGRMRRVSQKTLNYECRFACVRLRGATPSRAAQAFRAALLEAHTSRDA